ncbi:MAG: phosphate signaling complex protein PhoU [Treponema sp.]|nr:phosphate signaling complex protein PhoU [Treponema sp.]
MGTMCVDCIKYAMQALLKDKEEMAQRAIQLEKDIDQKEREIQSLCMKLILKQQPVAGDLRTINAALKMVTDMERIGDQGSDIAEITRTVDLTKSKKNVHIAEMADTVITMVTDAVESFVEQNEQLALAVQKQDDVVDELFHNSKKELLDMICGGIQHSPDLGEEALETLLIAKYLERIGDHTVNITEWVLYEIDPEKYEK